MNEGTYRGQASGFTLDADDTQGSIYLRNGGILKVTKHLFYILFLYSKSCFNVDLDTSNRHVAVYVSVSVL